jgi:hypothetical protein
VPARQISTRSAASATPAGIRERLAGAARCQRVLAAKQLPCLWITERTERRTTALQQQVRVAHQHLGVPPLGSLP